MPEPPAELRWNGRVADQSFEADESLYYRVPQLDGRGRVSGVDIRCPDTSVNRGKYSRPEYLLWKWVDHGVVEFLVGDIPTPILSSDGQGFDFKIVHDPVKPPEEPYENFAHSEIRAFRDSDRRLTMPKLVKKEFRQALSDRMRPIIYPAKADSAEPT